MRSLRLASSQDSNWASSTGKVRFDFEVAWNHCSALCVLAASLTYLHEFDYFLIGCLSVYTGYCASQGLRETMEDTFIITELDGVPVSHLSYS